MQVSKGRHKDHSEQARSSKCTIPRAVSDCTGWQDSAASSTAGDIDPPPAPRARAFYKASHESSQHGAPRHTWVELGCSQLDSRSQFMSRIPRKGPSALHAGMVKGNSTLKAPQGDTGGAQEILLCRQPGSLLFCICLLPLTDVAIAGYKHQQN